MPLCIDTVILSSYCIYIQLPRTLQHSSLHAATPSTLHASAARCFAVYVPVLSASAQFTIKATSIATAINANFGVICVATHTDPAVLAAFVLQKSKTLQYSTVFTAAPRCTATSKQTANNFVTAHTTQNDSTITTLHSTTHSSKRKHSNANTYSSAKQAN